MSDSNNISDLVIIRGTERPPRARKVKPGSNASELAPLLVSLDGVSALTGGALESLRKILPSGLAATLSGGVYLYPLSTVMSVLWNAARRKLTADVAEARARKDTAEARLKERKLEEIMGQLVSRARVDDAFADLATGIDAWLESLADVPDQQKRELKRDLAQRVRAAFSGFAEYEEDMEGMTDDAPEEDADLEPLAD